MTTTIGTSHPKSDTLAAKDALSRRSVFKLTGLAGGGLALGYALGSGRFAADALAADGADSQDFQPNGYIQIRPDGPIILYARNPEIGQGVKTALPMVVAEELDAAWADVQVEQAPIDESLFVARQGAGGSQSVHLSWDEQRQAGAAARAMLVSAAANRWQVSADECETADSAVIHTATGRRLTYGELAEDAAGLPVPDPASLRLKDRSEYKLLGTRVRDVDIEKIVSGELTYISDLTLPDMLYGVVEKCPARGGSVRSANLDQVRALEGVVDAFIVEGQGDFRTEQMPGVAIVATNTWAALKAKSALVVEWDETNASKDSWSNTVAAAQALKSRRGDDVILEKGDVDGAFDNAATVVEASYTYPFLAHATMEPMNCVAWHRGNEVELWTGSQAPMRSVRFVSRFFDIPEENITIHQYRAGGGFGRRGRPDFVLDAVRISERVGAPVKVQWTREDDMRNDHYRPGGVHHVAGALDDSGRMTAIRDHFVTLSTDGEKAISGADMWASVGPGQLLDNADYTRTFLPWTIPGGAWRAPASNAFGFVFQSFLHEMSVAAGRDHLEFLLEVLGERRWLEPQTKGALNTARAADVITLAAEKAGWGRTMPEGRGLGIGFYFSHYAHVAEVAEVSMAGGNELTVHKVTVAADIGPIVNMSGAEGQVEGSVIDGLSSMVDQALTIENGRVVEGNFDLYPLLKIASAPEVEVHFIQSDNPPVGLGEPALPPLIPAVTNAIYAATGHRVRSLPLNLEGFSV